MRRILSILILGSQSIVPLWAETPKISEEDMEFFEKKIRPILVESCYECHSTEKKKSKGGLQLDSREAILKGGDTGTVLVPGNPDESILIQAVRRLDKDIAMPPKKELPQAQVADLIEWVKRGAPDPRTGVVAEEGEEKKPAYDYEAERKKWAFKKPEKPTLPTVQNAAWVKTPVDAFVLAKMEAEGVNPAPQADKLTLIRRVTFDLIGLPPTPDEVSAFLKDEAPDAYQKIVERLLASPHYGEQWGRHWLDVVRYADSWDSRFTNTEFDFMDAWRYRDWVVRAYNRDLPYDQFITDQLAGDILATQQWDPDKVIATGVFALGSWGNGDADKKKIHSDIVDDQIDVVGRGFLGMTFACARCHDHKFDPIETADYYALSGFFYSSRILDHFQPASSGEKLMRIPLVPAKDRGEFESLKKKLENVESRLATVLRPLAEVKQNAHDIQGLIRWTPKGVDNPSVAINTTAQEIAFLTVKLPPHSIALHPGPKTSVTAAWKAPGDGKAKVKAFIKDADPLCGDGITWSVRHASKKLREGVFANNGTAEFPETEVIVKKGELIQLTINRGAEYSCDSTEVNLMITTEDGKVWDLREALVSGGGQGHDGVWWVCEGEGTWILNNDSEVSGLENDRKSLTARIKDVPMSQGFQEGGIPDTEWAGFNDSKVHVRGRYDRLGEPTPRIFPRLLAGDQQTPVKEGSGRLALAQWIVSEENPLAARVMANRIWQGHFGEGIVRTSNNYGKLGTPPSHPELLDWLALKFKQGVKENDPDLAGLNLTTSQPWSVKAMHRIIMLSSTYQQSSSASAETLKTDAGNDLFSRFNRQRLSAEEMRDSLLMAAGGLDRAEGGPSIAELTAPRRTLYVTTVRSNRATYQMLFDGADPGGIVEKRTDSVVAPQALWLLNSPFALAQAEGLTRRMEKEAHGDRAPRIAWLYNQLFGREPKPEEITLCETLLKSDDSKYWFQLCQMLLSSNEFAYID